MRLPQASWRTWAVGAGVILLALAGLTTLLRGDSDTSQVASPPAGPVVPLVLDADGHGAIAQVGDRLRGVDAAGRTRWERPVTKDDQFVEAVCAAECPAAEFSFGRSGSFPPDREDSPRYEVRSKRWDVRAQRPVLPVDRPLLPGPRPVRLAQSGSASARLVGVRGAAARDAQRRPPLARLAANRHSALVVALGGRSALSWLARDGQHWTTTGSTDGPRDVSAACVDPDGANGLLLTTAGPQLVVRSGAPRRALPGLLAAERNGGACALRGDRAVVAVMSDGTAGRQTQLFLHSRGQRTKVVRLADRFPNGMWIGADRGRTAVLLGDELIVLSGDGRIVTRRPDVAGAVQVASGRLEVIGTDLKRRRPLKL